MMKWFRRKSLDRSSVIGQFMQLAGATWTKKSYAALALEGYSKNIVAYHCISKIAKAVADIPFYVKINENEVENDPFTKLLLRPSPKQTYQSFMQQLVMHRLISGNSYVYGNVVSTKKIMELTVMRPDRVTIDVTKTGIPYQYVYNINGEIYKYPIDPFTFVSSVLHMKEQNPLDDLYGMSPISAAAMSIDQHNESQEWNKKLLQNSARPPGVLTLKDRGDTAQSLTDKQKEDLRDQIENKFAGYKNAGKIPILTFDMEWRSMGMSPTDMDWLNGKNSTARDICLAFGFPPHLLGLSEGSTFNNVAEAKMALYEETVIPLCQSMLAELGNFFSQHSGKTIEVIADLDGVTALAPRREMARNNARQDLNAGIITINEAREEIGYDAVTGGDEIMVPSSKLPLNFDINNMNESKFNEWLQREGFTKDDAEKISKLAYDMPA